MVIPAFGAVVASSSHRSSSWAVFPFASASLAVRAAATFDSEACGQAAVGPSDPFAASSVLFAASFDPS